MFVVAAGDTPLLGVEQTGKSLRREQPGELEKQ
jgi:hypothetical protein